MPADLLPEDSVLEYPCTDELKGAPACFALDYWRAARGSRLFPSRKDLKLRELAGILTHMALVKVIDGGADFENRFMGDAQVRAFTVPMQNRRLSEVARDDPQLVAGCLPVFRRAIETKTPQVLRSRTGHNSPAAAFIEGETLFLPLGDSDEEVDYIALFSTYTTRMARAADKPGEQSGHGGAHVADDLAST